MDVEETQARDVPAFENCGSETRQPWVAPIFERLPLNEAMSLSVTIVTRDGGTQYT